ncbi:DUF2637 domain-containing protein [Streptomyces sp. B8F3]|uniref:DUF2637 domain-containing protein n=1 Tax=unclassified Streptomyces TaxID=2593676 RepID=UPI00325DDE2E
MPTPAPIPATPLPERRAATGWDRAAITLLGAAGCALSYDALQQMAIAIHIRWPLTYLFPLVIDGFIAYGVRGLLVLRAAPLRARLYVGALFAIATAASIWANALHAIRLNQLPTTTTGLHLGDTTVAVLSTIAPLALAGAVHLHILIARHGHTSTPDHPPAHRHPHTTTEPITNTVRTTETPAAEKGSSAGANGTPATHLPAVQPDPPTPDHAGETNDGPTTADTDEMAQPPHATPDQPVQRRTGRPPGAELDELLAIARQAVETHGETSRTAIETAIRNQGLTISGERLTKIMKTLRAEADTPSGQPYQKPLTSAQAPR